MNIWVTTFRGPGVGRHVAPQCSSPCPERVGLISGLEGPGLREEAREYQELLREERHLASSFQGSVSHEIPNTKSHVI